MWSPQTAGVEPPLPGNGIFQATFFCSLHAAGRLVSLLRPLLSGPRQAGQLSARAAIRPHTRSNPPARLRRFTAVFLPKWFLVPTPGEIRTPPLLRGGTGAVKENTGGGNK